MILLGLIHENHDIDQWRNPVSLIEFPDGTKFRMVHLSKPGQRDQRAKIYGREGRFLWVRIRHGRNDCEVNSINVNGYEVAWGDGENLGSNYREINPREGNTFHQEDKQLLANLGHVNEAGFYRRELVHPTLQGEEVVILMVLANFLDTPDAWEFRPKGAPNPYIKRA